MQSYTTQEVCEWADDVRWYLASEVDAAAQIAQVMDQTQRDIWEISPDGDIEPAS